MKDSYELITDLNRSRLRALLDEKKVLMSVLYSDALIYSIEHFIKHGNSTVLSPMVDVFTNRDYKLFVAAWICERLGFKSKMGEKGAVFTRSGTAPNERMSFKVSLEEFAGNKFILKIPVKPVVAVKKKSPKRVDMLDTWARLPGSYGSGKR